MITQDTIGTIISAARIEEVIGDFVLLKRRGVNFLGLCPFHNEKTPSFTVSPVKGIYKCFGCGKAGNTIGFLMEHEHFSYPEALRWLAKRYQIEIEEEKQTTEQIQEQNEKEGLFLLNQFAQQYFSSVLFETVEGKAIGLTYFHERGFRDETIKKFMLGYAQERWDDFSNHARLNGYKPEYLVKTGLSVEKEIRLIDRFRGRVIFPIHSASGRVIGFGGRILTSDKNVAKYLNSPESEIYNKSKSLYGIYFAKNAIVSQDTCFLVEGYTDVISLHQAGIENVVASSGTSLTEDQVKLIRRYTANITILYDGDPAGIKASFRGIDMILQQGMNVRIVLFPDGDDPDSFTRKNRTSEVEDFIKRNAVNFILFKTRLLLAETQGDPIKKAGLVKEIVETIALIPDGISRSVYIKECSRAMNVPEQVLINELNKILRKNFSKKIKEETGSEDMVPEITGYLAPEQVSIDFNSTEDQEKEVIRILLLYGNEEIVFQQMNEFNELEDVSVKVSDFVLQDILNDEIPFENSLCQKIFTEMAGLRDNGTAIEKDLFIRHTEMEISTLAIDLCITPYDLSENWKENHIYVNLESDKLKDTVIMAIMNFKARRIQRIVENNQKKLKELQESNASFEEITALLSEQRRLEEINLKIQNEHLGRIVIR